MILDRAKRRALTMATAFATASVGVLLLATPAAAEDPSPTPSATPDPTETPQPAATVFVTITETVTVTKPVPGPTATVTKIKTVVVTETETVTEPAVTPESTQTFDPTAPEPSRAPDPLPSNLTGQEEDESSSLVKATLAAVGGALVIAGVTGVVRKRRKQKYVGAHAVPDDTTQEIPKTEDDFYGVGDYNPKLYSHAVSLDDTVAEPVSDGQLPPSAKDTEKPPPAM